MKGFTRRSFLAAAPAIWSGISPQSRAATTATTAKRTKPLPSAGEFVRFLDPTTESVVVRLTNPSHTSLLPPPANRFISVKERFLVCTSDRSGRANPYRLDLHTGLAAPLGQFDDLLASSLCLDASGRSLYLLDGNVLREVSLATRRSRTIADGIEAFSVGSSDKAIAVVKRGNVAFLNAVNAPVAVGVAPWCLTQPTGAGCLFARGRMEDDGELWYATQGESVKPTLLARGPLSGPLWAPDGTAVLFLRNVPSASGIPLAEIHEVPIPGGTERKVSSTSQFASFAPNGDGSVFVGASRSKAQPTVILLLRSLGRELTLCEHRASHPAAVAPVFSPDSRRVYFESDHEGKPAIYSVNVELLVEPTNAAA